MTAFTLTDTLSRVITSCGGTSMVIVLRLTFTILSMNGMSSTSPGPEPSPPGLKMALARRPNRKMTPRSYSRRMRTEEAITNNAITTAGIKPQISSKPLMVRLLRSRSSRGPCHGEREPVHAHDLDMLPRRHWAVRRHRAPQFAVDQDLSFGVERPPHHTRLSHHTRCTRRERPPQRSHAETHREHHQACRRPHRGHQHEPRDAQPALRDVVEHERPQHHRH